VAFSDTDFHRADVAPSRAHDSGLRRNDDTEESTSSRRIQNPSALSRGSFSFTARRNCCRVALKRHARDTL